MAGKVQVVQGFPGSEIPDLIRDLFYEKKQAPEQDIFPNGVR